MAKRLLDRDASKLLVARIMGGLIERRHLRFFLTQHIFASPDIREDGQLVSVEHETGDFAHAHFSVSA